MGGALLRLFGLVAVFFSKLKLVLCSSLCWLAYFFILRSTLFSYPYRSLTASICENKAAEEHYNQALEAEPDNVLAAFNLGTLFEDMGRIEDAITAYKQASNLADAHYNLSRLYELVGEHSQALKHLKTYRKLIEPS